MGRSGLGYTPVVVLAVKDKASKLALKVLDEHWQKQSVPINPIAIAESMGLTVRIGRLPADVSGALVGTADGRFEIVLSETDSPNRQRFTCAHEIGHYVERVSDGLPPKDQVDFRDYVSSQGTDEHERFANAFAAELLMPAWAVEQHRKVGFGASTMARMFLVSPSAMEIRLNSLDRGW